MNNTTFLCTGNNKKVTLHSSILKNNVEIVLEYIKIIRQLKQKNNFEGLLQRKTGVRWLTSLAG